MFSRGKMVVVLSTAALACSGIARALTIAPPPAPDVQQTVAISSWTALAAYSTDVVDPSRLCYWDFKDEEWIPADSQESIDLRKTDPRPVFREPNRMIGRCGGEPPVAALSGLGAVFSAFVYIASKDNDRSGSGTINPPPPPPPPVSPS